MSKRKQPQGLLGPDGKPLDRAKYAPPKPAPKATTVTTAEVSSKPYTYEFNFGSIFGKSFLTSIYGDDALRSVKAAPRKPALADAVARDIAALPIPDDFAGHDELPRPERDLTTYADALASAVKKCPHENTVNTMYGREWQCDDCGTYLDLRTMRKLGRLGFWS